MWGTVGIELVRVGVDHSEVPIQRVGEICWKGLGGGQLSIVDEVPQHARKVLVFRLPGPGNGKRKWSGVWLWS